MAWENFDAELQNRLTQDFDGGFNQVNGQTNVGYYQNSKDWKKVGNALGLTINSMNDVNALFDYVGSNKKKGKKNVSKSGGGAGGLQSGGSGASYSNATAFDPGTPGTPGTPFIPGSPAIEAVDAVEGVIAQVEKNPESNQEKEYCGKGC